MSVSQAAQVYMNEEQICGFGLFDMLELLSYWLISGNRGGEPLEGPRTHSPGMTCARASQHDEHNG